MKTRPKTPIEERAPGLRIAILLVVAAWAIVFGLTWWAIR